MAGVDLHAKLPLTPQFFTELHELFQNLHDRHIAYVDSNKRENILYGDDVPDATVEQLRSFYNDHQTGTIMAPLPQLNDQFALGAWVSDGVDGNAYLAKCGQFDEDAVSTFFRAFQFQGPERFDPSQLQPGM